MIKILSAAGLVVGVSVASHAIMNASRAHNSAQASINTEMQSNTAGPGCEPGHAGGTTSNPASNLPRTPAGGTIGTGPAGSPAQGKLVKHPDWRHGGGRRASSPGANSQTPRQDRVKNGTYNATVSGYYHGSGSANVGTASISISADVTTEDNRAGQLTASNLTVDGPYFYGVGKLFGNDVYITGRVDAARASRLMAIFSTDDGRNGRIVALPPASLDHGDDQWDDHD